ncbi:Major Facilitator Superfamily protein [Aspergillus niger]|uniref:Major Facilitator Superfamily protein n=1 Tax=Aspergillus niger TaxID=5061 RepID=A0A505I5T2_ASPNG|nr:Major Facilitator Superfamily protein [Aspergillus niger]
MAVRDTVLLLVSVGRFGCFGYGAASLREYDLFFRTSIEGACSGSLRGSWLLQSQTSAAILSRVRYISADIVSLFESSMPALFEGLVALSQPLSPSWARFILADIGDVSLREFDGLLNLVPALFESLVSNPLPCLLESPAYFLCRLSSRVPVGYSLYRPTESTASFCLRLSASVKVRHVSARDRRPIPLAVTEARMRLFAGLTSKYLVSEGRQAKLKLALTTSIEYHASLTRTKPGLEIAMRKVQEDRLKWEHDMIAKLGDFPIEEVDQQLQDTRSKGSCWYMKSTYNDIPIHAVGHLRRDGPAAKVLPYKIDEAGLAFKRLI